MPTAFLFPGQGSQTPDMRDHVAAVRPDLLELAVRGRRRGPVPPCRRGHALRPAGDPLRQPRRLERAATARAARRRRRALARRAHRARRRRRDLRARRAAPRRPARSPDGRRRRAPGDGTMLAALGGDARRGRRDRRAPRRHRRQRQRARPARPLRRARGARRRRPPTLRELPARASSSSTSQAPSTRRCMADAVPEFGGGARAAPTIAAPRDPRSTPASPRPRSAAVGRRSARRLADGLTRPSAGARPCSALHAAGVDDFVDAGPGNVLTKLVKRTLPREPSSSCVHRVEVRPHPTAARFRLRNPCARGGSHALRPLCGPRRRRPGGRRRHATIAARLGVEPEWIVSRTGIEERRVAAPGERLTDLAADAGRAALARRRRRRRRRRPGPRRHHVRGRADRRPRRRSWSPRARRDARRRHRRRRRLHRLPRRPAARRRHLESGRAETVLLIGAERARALHRPRRPPHGRAVRRRRRARSC